MRKILLGIPLVTMLLVRPALATSIAGSSVESRADQWLVGASFILTNQTNPAFSQTFTFTNSVVTKRVQISYRCQNCSIALFFVRLPGQSNAQLMTPLIMQNTVNSNVVEFSVNSKTINSITMNVASTGTGNLEVQMLGTNLP